MEIQTHTIVFIIDLFDILNLQVKMQYISDLILLIS